MQRKVLRTELCDIMEIEYPIMALCHHSPKAAAALSNAGGLGVVNVSTMGPDTLYEYIREIRSITDKPFGVDVLLPSTSPEAGSATEFKLTLPPEHVAFVDKLKKELGVPEPKERPEGMLAGQSQENTKELVEIVLEERVPVFVSGLGNPAWVVPEAHARGMKVMGIAGNVKNACRIADSGVDVVIATGHEAGGHVSRIGTLALIPQVVDAISPVPVAGGGGVGDARGLVALLCLGAVGAWCGTLFLATEECSIEDFWKQKILDSSEEGTNVSKIFSGKTVRTTRNKLVEVWDKYGMPTLPMPHQSVLIGDLQQGLREAGMVDYLGIPAGQIIGMIKEVKPVKQIVEEMVQGAIELLEEVIPRRITLR